MSCEVKWNEGCVAGLSWLSELLDPLYNGVIMINENEEIIVFNRAARQIFGLTSGEVLGRFIQELKFRTKKMPSNPCYI